MHIIKNILNNEEINKGINFYNDKLDYKFNQASFYNEELTEDDKKTRIANFFYFINCILNQIGNLKIINDYHLDFQDFTATDSKTTNSLYYETANNHIRISDHYVNNCKFCHKGKDSKKKCNQMIIKKQFITNYKSPIKKHIYKILLPFFK